MSIDTAALIIVAFLFGTVVAGIARRLRLRTDREAGPAPEVESLRKQLDDARSRYHAESDGMDDYIGDLFSHIATLNDLHASQADRIADLEQKLAQHAARQAAAQRALRWLPPADDQRLN